MFVQLSGVPGVGKSTLGRGLARERGYVVLDTDVVKSALIDSSVPLDLAGRAGYATAVALAADVLAQGRSAVLDSPCRYEELLDSGQAVAAAAGVPYAFVELRVDDIATLLPRLDSRSPRVSQLASSRDPVPGTSWELGSPERTLRAWQAQLVRPESGWVAVNAARPPSEVLAEVLHFLDEAAGSAP